MMIPVKQTTIDDFEAETIALKKCTKCEVSKPATAEYYYRDKSKKCGLRARCKECANEYNREYMRKYYQTEKGKEIVKKAVSKYQESEKGKEARERYRKSEEGKEANRRGGKKYRQSEKGKEAKRKYRQSKKVNIMSIRKRIDVLIGYVNLIVSTLKLKKCSICNQLSPTTPECFYRNNGLKHLCEKCRRIKKGK